MPHAEIYGGWDEVGIPGQKAYPDALAWEQIDGRETLFWLEVESGHSSKNLILDKTTVRWLKAIGYAEAVGIHLVLVFLAMPLVLRAVAKSASFPLTQRTAVILDNWMDYKHLAKPNFEGFNSRSGDNEFRLENKSNRLLHDPSFFQDFKKR